MILYNVFAQHIACFGAKHPEHLGLTFCLMYPKPQCQVHAISPCYANTNPDICRAKSQYSYTIHTYMVGPTFVMHLPYRRHIRTDHWPGICASSLLSRRAPHRQIHLLLHSPHAITLPHTQNRLDALMIPHSWTAFLPYIGRWLFFDTYCAPPHIWKDIVINLRNHSHTQIAQNSIKKSSSFYTYIAILTNRLYSKEECKVDTGSQRWYNIWCI